MKKNTPPQGLLAEAWQRMNADLDKVLPQALRGRRGKWKFSLGLALVELLLLGLAGKLLYSWFSG